MGIVTLNDDERTHASGFLQDNIHYRLHTTSRAGYRILPCRA